MAGHIFFFQEERMEREKSILLFKIQHAVAFYFWIIEKNLETQKEFEYIFPFNYLILS